MVVVKVKVSVGLYMAAPTTSPEALRTSARWTLRASVKD